MKSFKIFEKSFLWLQKSFHVVDSGFDWALIKRVNKNGSRTWFNAGNPIATSRNPKKYPINTGFTVEPTTQWNPAEQPSSTRLGGQSA